MVAKYDIIGINYAQLRKPDPRIAGIIAKALGPAQTVLNVGAGTDVTVSFKDGGSITLQGGNVIHGDHSDGHGGFDISTLVSDPSQIQQHS